ncbi:hypothetical protein CMV_014792, partial [Castanea mollissima]
WRWLTVRGIRRHSTLHRLEEDLMAYYSPFGALTTPFARWQSWLELYAEQ